jgi:murein DD-endopeptidase MepM/ murein hydrolase activator NlpD
MQETVTPNVVPPQYQQAAGNSSVQNGKPASLGRPTGGVLGSYNPASTTATQQPIDTEVETAKLATNKNTTVSVAPITKESPVAQDGKFMWPVQGKVVKKFGQQGAEYNDGINISASAGTAVKASNSGRVVYTGNSLKSYGNLVIIKHDNGLLSAYAHMKDVNVKKDQQISKGQIIGTVGSTGKVTSPQLYFAIRKGKDAKNPMNYLK